MKAHEKFNNSVFGCWINSRNGRLFRFIAGLIFLTLGIFYFPAPLAIASLIWSVLPISAGLFNICWVSLVLGGPISSSQIILQQRKEKS